MRVGVLFSGGKDSCYAVYLTKKMDYKVSCLISIESKNKESFMFHTPFIELTKKQADVIGIPIVYVKTEGKKEKELEDLEKAIKIAIKKFKIKGIVSGAIESVYQASRIQKICNKLKIECFNPLWQKNPIEHWNDILRNNFRVVISSVSAEGLDKKWVGVEIDKRNLKELVKLSEKYKFNLNFEGGEAETFVFDGPIFKKKLRFDLSYEDSYN